MTRSWSLFKGAFPFLLLSLCSLQILADNVDVYKEHDEYERRVDQAVRAWGSKSLILKLDSLNEDLKGSGKENYSYSDVDSHLVIVFKSCVRAPFRPESARKNFSEMTFSSKKDFLKISDPIWDTNEWRTAVIPSDDLKDGVLEWGSKSVRGRVNTRLISIRAHRKEYWCNALDDASSTACGVDKKVDIPLELDFNLPIQYRFCAQ